MITAKQIKRYGFCCRWNRWCVRPNCECWRAIPELLACLASSEHTSLLYWIVPTGNKGAKHQASYLQTSRSCVPVQLYCGWKIAWTSPWAHSLNSEGIQNTHTHKHTITHGRTTPGRRTLSHSRCTFRTHLFTCRSFKRTTSWALSRSPLKRPQHVCISGNNPQIVSGIQANLVWQTSHDTEIQ